MVVDRKRGIDAMREAGERAKAEIAVLERVIESLKLASEIYAALPDGEVDKGQEMRLSLRLLAVSIGLEAALDELERLIAVVKQEAYVLCEEAGTREDTQLAEFVQRLPEQ